MLGILELPFLCTCMSACAQIGAKLTIFETNLMLRGGLYFFLGAGSLMLSAILPGDPGLFLNLGFSGMMIDGLLYLLLLFRRSQS